MIEIKLVLPKGISAVSQLSSNVQNALLKGLVDGLELIRRTSRTQYLSGPYPSRLSKESGTLKDSLEISATKSSIAGEFARGEIRVSPGAINPKGMPAIVYGKVHEGPGDVGFGFYIYAKGSKPMRFFWKHRGIWMSTYRVIIPSRPFLKPAVLDNIEKIRLLLQRIVSKAYKGSMP